MIVEEQREVVVVGECDSGVVAVMVEAAGQSIPREVSLAHRLCRGRLMHISRRHCHSCYTSFLTTIFPPHYWNILFHRYICYHPPYLPSVAP